MSYLRHYCLKLSAFVAAWALFGSVSAGTVMQAEVDLRNVSRNLLKARLTIPVEKGPMALWYPKWVPGIHGPTGPVINLAGLKISTPDGERIAWHRQSSEPYRFDLTVPDNVDAINVQIQYICNQPQDVFVGADTQGTSSLGIVNWNTCLLYPDGFDNDAIQVDLKATLPNKWKFATALTTKKADGNQVEFQRASLRQLIDSPLICGEYLQSYTLSSAATPVYLHVVSESQAATQMITRYPLLSGYQKLVKEAEMLFGDPPFKQYDFLLVCSDEVKGCALEHLESSLNVVEQYELFNSSRRRGLTAELLPHEFVHAWCGKLRRPAGMLTDNYHDAKDLRLLWVYEGLTEYLGKVLTVRSGLHSTTNFREQLAYMIQMLKMQRGRRWRSLEDTAATSYQLRSNSRYWRMLRRSQDYYEEGTLYWMEVDCMIRQETSGKRSLDDFCKSFFNVDVAKSKPGYNVDDICKALHAVANRDWQGFFDRRVSHPHDSIPLDVVGLAGYRLEFQPAKNSFQALVESRRGDSDECVSLGMRVSESGSVNTVVPGSVADKHGLCKGVKVVAIDGRQYSRDRLTSAIAQSVQTRKIELIVQHHQRLRNVTLPYKDGKKYLRMTRDSTKPDLLSQIVRARSTRVR